LKTGIASKKGAKNARIRGRVLIEGGRNSKEETQEERGEKGSGYSK